MVNTKITLIIFFAAKDGEALYSQQKQDQEQTEAQIMNSLVISNVEYIFLYLSVICMSLLEKCLSRSVHFLIELFFNREGYSKILSFYFQNISSYQIETLHTLDSYFYSSLTTNNY